MSAVRWSVSKVFKHFFYNFFFCCCALHTYQHMLCIVAIGDFTHVHHVVHYTHINTCYVWLLLWLYPCKPCCPLHTYQHMLCIVAIGDSNHVHHVVHYTHNNTCYVLLLLLALPMYTMLSTTHISTHAMYCCYCWFYPCAPCCPLHTYQHMLCIVAIVDFILSGEPSSLGLGNS